MPIAVQEGGAAVINHELNLAGAEDTVTGLEGPPLVAGACGGKRTGRAIELITPHQNPVLRACNRRQKQEQSGQDEKQAEIGRLGKTYMAKERQEGGETHLKTPNRTCLLEVWTFLRAVGRQAPITLPFSELNSVYGRQRSYLTVNSQLALVAAVGDRP